MTTNNYHELALTYYRSNPSRQSDYFKLIPLHNYSSTNIMATIQITQQVSVTVSIELPDSKVKADKHNKNPPIEISQSADLFMLHPIVIRRLSMSHSDLV